MPIVNHRQQAPTIDGIRADHVARYRFAAELLGGDAVLDAACGCGYGSAILAQAGCLTVGVDKAPEAIAWARSYFGAGRTVFLERDLAQVEGPFDAVVSFETLEHLDDPLPALAAFAACAHTLVASVPNETLNPYRAERFPDHVRHYSPADFDALLRAAGWRPLAWHHQADRKPGTVLTGPDGIHTIVVAER